MVLFVCTGNTCRSPMAAGLYGGSAKSAGLAASDGQSATFEAIAAAAKHGADISSHRSQAVTEELVRDADAVFGVTAAHAERLKTLFPRYADKVFALPEEIPDPFGGDQALYDRTADGIRRALGKIALLIVPLRENRATEMSELEKLCFSMPWTLAMIEAELSHSYAHYWGALSGDRLVGYAGMQIVLDEGYITNVAAHPDFRRRGVGGALIAKMVAYGQEKRLRFLTLEVRESNAAAIALYEKHGFERWGTRPNYYTKPTENALLLTKYLKESANHEHFVH